MEHNNLMVTTLKTQYVLHQYWYMKIEQFSPLDVKGPHNILATTIQGSIAWLLWLRSWRGRNSQSPQRFLLRKKMKCISWIKNTLVFMMIKFGSVLSVISTYLKLHIWIKNPLNYAHFCELQQQNKQLLVLQVNYSDS